LRWSKGGGEEFRVFSNSGEWVSGISVKPELRGIIVSILNATRRRSLRMVMGGCCPDRVTFSWTLGVLVRLHIVGKKRGEV